jgi:hypothetical protein
MDSVICYIVQYIGIIPEFRRFFDHHFFDPRTTKRVFPLLYIFCFFCTSLESIEPESTMACRSALQASSNVVFISIISLLESILHNIKQVQSIIKKGSNSLEFDPDILHKRIVL